MRSQGRCAAAAILLALTMLPGLSGCGSSSAPGTQPGGEASSAEPGSTAGQAAQRQDGEAVVPAEAQGAEQPAQGGTARSQPRESVAGQPAATPIAEQVGLPSAAERKIIKDAELTVEVEDLQLAMSRVGGIAAQMGGYLMESRTDIAQSGAESALIKITVPVAKFELALGRIRELGQVQSEHSSGADVTQEFVDVQSQIANLEATQARVREFLDQAANVEEALRVNAQLSEIEGKISQLKGRLQFLSQRAAYSTITSRLRQAPSAVELTATPTPAPFAWQPGDTANSAFSALKVVLQVLGTVGIWLAIFVLPLALPAVAIVLILRSRRSRAAQQPLADDAGSSKAS